MLTEADQLLRGILGPAWGKYSQTDPYLDLSDKEERVEGGLDYGDTALYEGNRRNESFTRFHEILKSLREEMS